MDECCFSQEILRKLYLLLVAIIIRLMNDRLSLSLSRARASAVLLLLLLFFSALIMIMQPSGYLWKKKERKKHRLLFFEMTVM